MFASYLNRKRQSFASVNRWRRLPFKSISGLIDCLLGLDATSWNHSCRQLEHILVAAVSQLIDKQVCCAWKQGSEGKNGAHKHVDSFFSPFFQEFFF